MKEYTGSKGFTSEQFEIEFHERYLEWLKGGKVGVDPMTQWQCLSYTTKNVLEDGNGRFPMFVSDAIYRWKPAPKRMVTIGFKTKEGVWMGKPLVAPELEAPAQGTSCYCSGYCGISPFQWNADMKEYLDNGLVFLRKEDAQAMADWLAVCRRGEAK